MENARELTARLMASVEAAFTEREARTQAILETTVYMTIVFEAQRDLYPRTS